MKISKILPVAALGVALSIGANQQAEAYAYSYSDLWVANGEIIVTNGSLLADPDSTSTAGSTVGESGITSSDTTITTVHPFPDAPIVIDPDSSFVGLTAPGENSFSLVGSSTDNTYSWADSLIVSEQEVTGGVTTAFIETRQIAEGNAIDTTLAKSNADTSSLTTMLLAIEDPVGSLAFSFDAQLRMLSEITAPHTGIQALSTADVTITLLRKTSLDGTVCTVNCVEFSWTAGVDGDNGFNVASQSDAFLFTSTNVTTPGSQTNENLWGRVGGNSFSALSGGIAGGTFELSLRASVSERAQASPIPTPGSVALLGLGLVLLGASRRKALSSASLAA